MKDFNRINNITGWLIFIIATVVYTLTVEETASFWDCGEFIAVSYKLEVPHPPGAPLFLMLGRFFSLFTDDVTKVAFSINMLSVVASGFTILFLYWTIVLFGRKLINAKIGEETLEQGLLLITSGIVGALAYTFSDSFWFSAVEAEVYALSSFFTAFVVWAMLKWELVEDERMANRWLLLIAYMVGLSIGVHLLNLVTIPALALIMYFKHSKNSTLTGGVITMVVGLIIVGVIQVGIIPGLPSIAGQFEIFFVNSLGMGFGSGIIVFCLLLFGGLIAGIWFTQKKGLVNPNTILLALTFILIGYSSYTMVVIRSNYNPPIDENDPQDVMSFVSYLKREQYGSRPLLFGPYYNTKLEDQVSGEAVYVKGKDKYEIADYKVENKWAESHFFPRIWNSEPRYQQQYMSMLGLQKGEEPSFGDNLSFMFRHQIGHMYMRYFMWNFAGRESDIQDAGYMLPWSSDEGLPYEIKENKARNQYFMLPLILGLLGLVFNFSKNQKTGIIVTLLFLLLGVALVMYLNSPPSEPRERDYIYAGSFYAFCIWIGFGVMALADMLRPALKNSQARVATAFIISLIAAPVLMASENWDDHDRSNRYFSVDAARNYLESCAPNAILFTGGDNDTFPLWYLQEVEGVRTDVRVIVLSYFNTDWYIEQMHRQAYESDPLPFTLSEEMIQQGGPVDYLPYVPSNQNIDNNGVNLKEYLNLLNKGSRSIIANFDKKDYARLLSKKFFLPVDSSKAASIVPDKFKNRTVDTMWFNVNGNGLYKNDFMILDLIAGNNWERPIYFNSTSMRSVRFDIQDYLVQEGLTYRLVPARVNTSDYTEATDTDQMYKNVMEKWQFRELNNPDSYYNEDYRGFVQNHRYAMNALAEALVNDGEFQKSFEVINKSLSDMPDQSIPYDFSILQTVEILYKLSSFGVSGAHEKAVELTKIGSERMAGLANYYIENSFQLREAERQLTGLNILANQAKNNDEMELATQISQQFNSIASKIGGR
ncbi:glycosyltransferase family 117 protein [Marinigracilibium pacificum]|uniref:DUF2723 domain-containing protein n=1 Tax=Marinigracilibium pacificum TaxID=2729599 RepID=A0A848IZZ0_9BACT|nr:DUF2723 domain-containing protein [Marinigracilibium pacificum]NMM48845.1 DUF2723 domain-containing protein [Marinigracilibium pacificum]